MPTNSVVNNEHGRYSIRTLTATKSEKEWGWFWDPILDTSHLGKQAQDARNVAHQECALCPAD